MKATPHSQSRRRRSKREVFDPSNTLIKLIRFSTWKCGHIERAILETIASFLASTRDGSKPIPAKLILERLMMAGEFNTVEVVRALKRLEHRRILKIMKIKESPERNPSST